MQFASMDLIWESSPVCVCVCWEKCDDVCITRRRTSVISLETIRRNACSHLYNFKLIIHYLQSRQDAVALSINLLL